MKFLMPSKVFRIKMLCHYEMIQLHLTVLLLSHEPLICLGESLSQHSGRAFPRTDVFALNVHQESLEMTHVAS